MKPLHSRNIIRLLLAANVLSLLLLGLLLYHYRVLPKLWRRLVVEKRVPLGSGDFRQNRNFSARMQIFGLYDPEPGTGLIYGDSQVAGVEWGELITDRRIAARGIDGDTLAGVEQRVGLQSLSDPAFLVFLVGTNDVLRGGTVSEIQSGVHSLLETARSRFPDSVRVMISLPPVAAWVVNAEQRNRVVAEVNAWMREDLEQTLGARFLDLEADWASDEGYLKGTFTSDGVHLSAEAYRVIQEKLPVLLSERMIETEMK